MAMGELDKGAGGKREEEEEEEVMSATLSCSICLEAVTSGGDRSTARLQCGHEFHLDCIGSAFNAKGSMQCPNCRKVEKGNWLYANGYRSSPEYSVDDWLYDEDLYDLGYTGTPFAFPWCPFGGVARMPSLFLEGDSSPTVAFQDFFRYHTNLAEHPPITSPSHPCPYLSYLHPLQPSSSSHPHASSENNGDPPLNQQWSHNPRPAEAHTFHAVGPGNHYGCLEYIPQSYPPPGVHSNVADMIAPSFRAVLDSSAPMTGASSMHPIVHNHGYGSRAGFNSSLFPPIVPHIRAEDDVEHIRHFDSQRAHGDFLTGASQSGGWMRSFGPNTSLPEQTGLFLHPSTSSDRTTADAGDAGRNNLHPAPAFPLLPLPRESSWWASSQHFAGSDSNNRLFACPQNPPERWFIPGRPESTPRRPMPIPRMHSLM